MEQYTEIISLTKENYSQHLPITPVAFSVAEGGAMGHPGRVVIIDKTNNVYDFYMHELEKEYVMKILPALYESKRAVLGIDPSTSGWNRVYLGMGNHLMVADSLRTMQRTVVKRFIHYKHNIILWNTQVFSRKVVTFFEDCKSWSHSSLFVWDWNCRARRIASNFTRFYRIAKGVTRRI